MGLTRVSSCRSVTAEGTHFSMVPGLPATIYTKCHAAPIHLNSFSWKWQGVRPQALIKPATDARCISEAVETPGSGLLQSKHPLTSKRAHAMLLCRSSAVRTMLGPASHAADPLSLKATRRPALMQWTMGQPSAACVSLQAALEGPVRVFLTVSVVSSTGSIFESLLSKHSHWAGGRHLQREGWRLALWQEHGR